MPMLSLRHSIFWTLLPVFNSFLQYQQTKPRSMGGNIVNNGWIELYLSFSQIVRKTDLDQLSAGITLKGTRGISGVYVHLDRLLFTDVNEPGFSPTFFVTDPVGKYGYSSNYDRFDDNPSGEHLKDFLVYTQGSASVDIGAEYLIKGNYAPQFDDDQKLEYDLKIGVAILDLGRTQFKHGRFSREFSTARTNVSEVELENKFSSPDDIEDFYDSLETVVQNFIFPQPEYYISQPTRLVVNVDKVISGNLFVNGELSQFFLSQNKKHLRTRELNMLTVTPDGKRLCWCIHVFNSIRVELGRRSKQGRTDGSYWKACL